MEIRANPTRMELNRLKKRLEMARRGHKLLKDKRDELIRQFMLLVRKNKDLREKIEQEHPRPLPNSCWPGRLCLRKPLKRRSYSTRDAALTVQKRNIMSVYAPQFSWQEKRRSRAITASIPTLRRNFG